MHIAQMPGVIAGFAAVPVLEMPGGDFVQDEAKSTAQVMSALDARPGQGEGCPRSLDDATMMSTWSFKLGGKTLMSMPRMAVVRAMMLNHWYHHRGQMSVYLRELNVPVPAIYGPSADENPFA